MRTLLTAIVALTIALPAWAANADRAPASKIEVCKLAGGSPLCTVKHSPNEEIALHNARALLEMCKDSGHFEWFGETREMTRTECEEVRSYAKKRWGY